ncbi:unnamed protein product [Rotaria magnacalcarata]|uniref:Bromo domain-containing protein n=1 Tax=Rotaria magnacalcarata TaxID=392030 RepID=A0A815H5E3_9BILA|nr:unnamed protein product [Rotaria magnacalcarata]
MEKQIQQTNNDIDTETASLRREDNFYKIRNNSARNYKLGVQTLIDPFMKLPNKISHLIQSIKTHTNYHGRTLSTAFLTLPSKIDYPDYYEIIQKPIDIRRIESRQYSSINELSSDLKLMFDNALLYNEPGSMIYRDALNLQRLLIEKKRDLTRDDSVQNLVCELLTCLFIETFNYEDQNGQCINDSFSELPEQAENEPFDIVYTFDMIRENLDQRRYRD